MKYPTQRTHTRTPAAWAKRKRKTNLILAQKRHFHKTAQNTLTTAGRRAKIRADVQHEKQIAFSPSAAPAPETFDSVSEPASKEELKKLLKQNQHGFPLKTKLLVDPFKKYVLSQLLKKNMHGFPLKRKLHVDPYQKHLDHEKLFRDVPDPPVPKPLAPLRRIPVFYRSIAHTVTPKRVTYIDEQHFL